MPSLAKRPPSHYWTAAADGNLSVIKQAVESGVSPNAKDENGYSAISAAVSYRHEELLDYLMSAGGDVNIRDSDGDTPLFACETIAMARLLVEKYGANVDLRNDRGLTAGEAIREEGEYLNVAAFLDGNSPLPIQRLDDQNDDAAPLNESSRRRINEIMDSDMTEQEKNEALRHIIFENIEDLMTERNIRHQ